MEAISANLDSLHALIQHFSVIGTYIAMMLAMKMKSHVVGIVNKDVCQIEIAVANKIYFTLALA